LGCVRFCCRGIYSFNFTNTQRRELGKLRRKVAQAHQIINSTSEGEHPVHFEQPYYSRANEEGAQALGVKYVSLPNRSTRSAEQRQGEKQRWFQRGQNWRTGCDGRISVLKRRHGLAVAVTTESMA